MPAAGDLAVLADVKSWLAITSSADDALLGRLITAASSFIVGRTNRQLLTASYTETYDGFGGIQKVLANYPITAVSAVAIDGQIIPATTAQGSSSGYYFDNDRLLLRGYTFNRGLANVSVSYTAGFATVPFDVNQACIEIVGIKYREMNRLGENSKSIGGETISFFQKDIPPYADSILQQYINQVPV